MKTEEKNSDSRKSNATFEPQDYDKETYEFLCRIERQKNELATPLYMLCFVMAILLIVVAFYGSVGEKALFILDKAIILGISAFVLFIFVAIPRSFIISLRKKNNTKVEDTLSDNKEIECKKS